MAMYPRVIYKITHNVTGRSYIGSTENFKKRIKSHMDALRGDRHPVRDMQNDYNEYGDDFSTEILWIVQSPDEQNKEYELMEKYRTRIRGEGYNYRDNHGITRVSGYYNAKIAIKSAGITLSSVAKAMGIATGTLAAKLGDRYCKPITLSEAKRFKKIVGSELPLEILFKKFEEGE